jgi:hypothetical protein
VLEKFGRHCTYCGVTNVPLNLDHVIPRARGGSNRPSNLVPAWIPCNTQKESKTIEEFLAGTPALLARVKAQIEAPREAAAATNATRNAPYEARADTGLPIETGSGGRTSFNLNPGVDRTETGRLERLSTITSSSAARAMA